MKRTNSYKCKVQSGVHRKRLLLKREHDFISAENSSSNHGVLDENVVRNLRGKSLLNKRAKRFLRQVEVINLDDPDIASKPQKRGRL